MQPPSSRIQYQFPCNTATSYREFALTVRRARLVTEFILRYRKAAEARRAVVSRKFVKPRKNFFNKTSLRVFGCCLKSNERYTRVLLKGLQAWTCCVVAWLVLSPVLLTASAVSWPRVCSTMNTTNSSNPTWVTVALDLLE